MQSAVDCEGAPRDLGLDQGRACAVALGASYDGLPLAERLRLRLARPDAVTARLARDVARYFPRHAETLDGMAHGARVPRAWLVEQLARAATCTASGFGLPALGATGPFVADAPFVARGLPRAWMLRRAAPEGGFRALEVAPSWFAGALAGVSEAGLVAAVVERAHDGSPAECAAPAALLVQDCLHRFESLGGALDWCLGRPAAGEAELVLADAQGDVATVSISAAGRRVHRPADGLASVSLDDEGAKAIREAAPLGARDVAGALGMQLALLDPIGRRIGVAAPGTEPEWVGL